MNRFFFSFRYLLVMTSLLQSTLGFAEGDPKELDTVIAYEFWPLFIKMLLLLGLMLAVLLGASYFLKKLMMHRTTMGNNGSQIEIIERKPLDGKTTLYLFRIGQQEVFAAEHANGFSSLAQWKLNTSQAIDNK